MSKNARRKYMNAPRGEQNGLSRRMERDFGDLEEEIKKIVESDVEDVDAARREDLTHLDNWAIDSAETTESR